MSEWVDFGLYALQAALLWMVLPSWVARLPRPLAADRDNDLPRSASWIGALRSWGASSIFVLLGYRLDMIPRPLSATALKKSGWEALLMTSNLMLALGLLFAGYGLLRFMRWLKEHAAQPQTRAAEEFPPTRDDFLPRWQQYLTYGLVAFALLARPIACFLQPDRVHQVWGNFLTGLVLALLLFFAAAGSVMRPPNQLDRMLGERWRQLEVSLCYLLMGSLSLLEIGGLVLELSGQMSRRSVALLVTGFVSVTLGSLMLLSSRQRGPAQAPTEWDIEQ